MATLNIYPDPGSGCLEFDYATHEVNATLFNDDELAEIRAKLADGRLPNYGTTPKDTPDD